MVAMKLPKDEEIKTEQMGGRERCGCSIVTQGYEKFIIIIYFQVGLISFSFLKLKLNQPNKKLSMNEYDNYKKNLRKNQKHSLFFKLNFLF